MPLFILQFKDTDEEVSGRVDIILTRTIADRSSIISITHQGSITVSDHFHSSLLSTHGRGKGSSYMPLRKVFRTTSWANLPPQDMSFSQEAVKYEPRSSKRALRDNKKFSFVFDSPRGSLEKYGGRCIAQGGPVITILFWMISNHASLNCESERRKRR